MSRPVLAAQMGYLPGTLWILVGVVLAGAVQDMIVLFAIPDYDAYLAPFRATHPGESPLDRGAFLAWALERRHAGRAAASRARLSVAPAGLRATTPPRGRSGAAR